MFPVMTYIYLHNYLILNEIASALFFWPNLMVIEHTPFKSFPSEVTEFLADEKCAQNNLRTDDRKTYCPRSLSTGA